MVDLPIVITSAGVLPTPPVSIRDQIAALAEGMSPGITNNLPGIMLEDILSTDVAAAVLCDAARVELINSLTPYGANDYLLSLLGNIYLGSGRTQAATRTSVQVVFSGRSGFVVAKGFVVSDGTYQYACTDGGVIGANGQSAPLGCFATTAGSWAVPPGTVTMLETSYGNSAAVGLSCSNPFAGVPGATSESQENYRARVLRAGLASGQGMPSYFRTLVANVPGVQQRLISFQQQPGGGWKAIVGGGDPYAVAWAIWQSVCDVSTLQPSVLTVDAITSGANAVVTTGFFHNLVVGSTTTIQGIAQGMIGINGVPLPVTAVLSNTSFQTSVDTALFGTYTSGGYLTPNPRNNSVALLDYPDTYQVAFVSPPAQQVAMVATWGTSIAGYVNVSAVAQLAAPALAAYVNAVPVGQPMSLYDLQDTFIAAVVSILPSQRITLLDFAVSINGFGVAPLTGTGVIAGDSESYLLTDATGLDIIVNQA